MSASPFNPHTTPSGYVPGLWARYQKANPDHIVVNGRNDLPLAIRKTRYRHGRALKLAERLRRDQWRAVHVALETAIHEARLARLLAALGEDRGR